MTGDLALVRLMQLVSPALPVGAYSYSQGLEAAVEHGLVSGADGTERWIGDVLEYSVLRLDAPVVLRLHRAWRRGDVDEARRWNAFYIASRETAELRAETVQMGYSLRLLLGNMGHDPSLPEGEDAAFPTLYAYAAAAWDVGERQAVLGYAWSWLESQVMAALKAVRLGQTAGQRMLSTLGERAVAGLERAQALCDEDIGSYLPMLAVLSSRHETQYSRLFRS